MKSEEYNSFAYHKVQNSKFKINAILDFSPGGIRPDKPLQEGVSCNTCNGENSKCEQECMMEAATKEIEYYDDEDLDRFAGRDADAYTDEEVEEFSEVLYTMQPEEVAGWNRSLILRGINLPNQLKDEVIGFLS